MMSTYSWDNVLGQHSNNKHLNYVGPYCYNYKSSSYSTSNEGTSSEGAFMISWMFFSILIFGFFFLADMLMVLI